MLKSDMQDDRAFGQAHATMTHKLSPVQNDEWVAVYAEGDLEYVNVPPVELQLISLEDEEDFQQESLKISLQQYHKSIRYLFQKYSVNQGVAARKRLLQADYKSNKLRIQDILGMLQDYDAQDLTNYEEVIQIIQTLKKRPTYEDSLQPYNQPSDIGYNSMTADQSYINMSSMQLSNLQTQQTQQSVLPKMSTNLRLDLPTFTEFLAQFALIVYSRPPQDLRKQHAGFIFATLMRHFGAVARRKGENNLIFDDPDGTTKVADVKTIQRWNLELALHPEIEVPESTHLRKVAEQDIIVQSTMKKNVFVGVPQNFLMIFELVNDLIASTFKTSIVEPKAVIKTVYRVKPLKAKGHHKDQTVDPLIERQENLRVSMSTVQIRQKPSKRIDLNKSLEVSISPSRFYEPDSIMSASTKVVNKFRQLKELTDKEKMLQEEMKHQKWLIHKEYLDKQHQKIKDHKYKVELDKLTKLQADPERKDRYSETVLPLLNQKMEQVNKYKSEIFETLKKKEEQEKQKAKEIEELKKKEQKEFFKNYTMKEISKYPKQKKKTKEELEKEQKELKAKEVEKAKAYSEKLLAKKKHLEELKKKQLEFNKKFKDLYKDATVQAVFKKFEKQGKKLFKFFYSTYSDSNNQMAKKMNKAAWMQFSQTFHIHPEVISEAQAEKIFSKTIDAKNHIAEIKSQNQGGDYKKADSLDYFEFEYCLLRLAIKSHGFYNKIAGQKNKIEQMKILHEYKKTKVPRDQVKRLQKIDEVKGTTVDGLISFLDVPEGKEAINAKLRHLQTLDQNLTKPLPQQSQVKQVIEQEAIPVRPKDRVAQQEWKEPGSHMKKEAKEKFDKKQQEKEEQEKKEKKEKKIFTFIKKQQDIEKLQSELEKLQKEKEKDQEKGKGKDKGKSKGKDKDDKDDDKDKQKDKDKDKKKEK